MDWGIVMSVFTVGGMLLLVFAQPRDMTYHTFGEDEINPPSVPGAERVVELKKAA